MRARIASDSPEQVVNLGTPFKKFLNSFVHYVLYDHVHDVRAEKPCFMEVLNISDYDYDYDTPALIVIHT